MGSFHSFFIQSFTKFESYKIVYSKWPFAISICVSTCCEIPLFFPAFVEDGSCCHSQVIHFVVFVESEIEL